MNFIELILLSVGLSMDAFAVAICKGTSINDGINNKAILIGLWFGLFQAIMPLIGYLLGSTFNEFLVNIDHFIAFFLLSYIGIGMIKNSLSDDNDIANDDIQFKVMFMLAIATSIDALAVGISFSLLNVNIFSAIIIIGIVSFIFSFLGVFIGKVFKNKFKKKAEIFGGLVLIVLAFKILFEHIGTI